MSQKSSATGKSLLWLWIVVLAIAVFIGLFLYSDSFKNLVGEITHWTKNLMQTHPLIGAVVFLVFAGLSAMLAFTSSVVLVPAANLVWGKLITFLLLWGGWVMGAVAAFGLGKLARPLIRRLGFQEKLEEYEQFVSRRMKFWAALVFCIAVPSEIPGYLFGSLRYPFPKFLGAIAIAEAIYALGIVLAGDSLITAEPLPLIATVVVLIAILVTARFLLRTQKRSKSRAATSR